MLANTFSTYVCAENNTLNGTNMDIVRVLVRIRLSFMLKKTHKFLIDGVEFLIMLKEDTYGPFYISKDQNILKSRASIFSSFEDNWTH